MSVLIALFLGTAAYLLTKEVIVGLLVAGTAWWFIRKSRRKRERRSGYPTAGYPDAPAYTSKAAVRDDGGIAVVCKQVTAERQEWASVKTGRLFDVLSPDGPPGAKPGDPGEVIVRGTRYLVRTPPG